MSPLVSRFSPLASRLSPLASRFSLLASRHLLLLQKLRKDLYEQHTFDPWLEESVREEMLKDLRERWEFETHGNAVFIAAIEKRNIDELRSVILNKVKELYQVRYPYKSEHFY